METNSIRKRGSGDPHMRIIPGKFCRKNVEIAKISLNIAKNCWNTLKFPFGESPFPNRVCFHLGTNIYPGGFNKLCYSALSFAEVF